MRHNVILNVDNTHEIEMVDELLRGECRHSRSQFGLRINPVVGGGAIALVSNATKLSKFGVPLTDETRARVLQLFVRYEWLCGVHLHVGSQGVPMELFVRGARVCMDLALEVEEVTGRRLSLFDIGGGLSSSYREEREPDKFGFARYRQLLERGVPELFSGRFRVVTEFGRALFNKCGATVTRVEHVKRWIAGLKPIIMTHVGTNQFLFESYMPSWCAHRFSLAGPDGRIRRKAEAKRKNDDEDDGDDAKDGVRLYDIGGPLCFQVSYSICYSSTANTI